MTILPVMNDEIISIK